MSALFAARIHFQWVKNSEGKKFSTGSVGLNCDQMEEGEQYSEYHVERNPRAYMSMRDHINQPWKNQQLVERNPKQYRSMRDYGNQWLSSPYSSTYNHSWGNHTNTSWEPRPPQYAFIGNAKQFTSTCDEDHKCSTVRQMHLGTIPGSDAI